MQITVSEIAERVGGTVVGDGSIRITGVNGIKEAAPGDLTYVADSRYLGLLGTTRASAILVSRDVFEPGHTLIQVENPYRSFYEFLNQVRPPEAHPVAGVHPTAVIAPEAVLGRNAAVGAHVFIGARARIGDDVVLYPGVYVGPDCVVGDGTVVYPNVVLREGVQVGARCILHSGVVLGADGFGFQPMGDVLHKVPQIGTVILGDDVEIGANSAVDRATFGATVIGRGTKVDNLVQIGHNVVIGEYCTISGESGVAGSAVIGNRVTIAAQAGIAGHLTIGDGVVIGARSGVTKSIPAGRVVSGFPAKDHADERRIQASFRQLPEVIKRLRALERRLAELEGNPHGATEDDSE